MDFCFVKKTFFFQNLYEKGEYFQRHDISDKTKKLEIFTIEAYFIFCQASMTEPFFKDS